MEGSQYQHLPYRGPVFEETTSPLYASNDGVLQVENERESRPHGFAVVDATDRHVELFTLKREIADAFVAGYDYATRQRDVA